MITGLVNGLALNGQIGVAVRWTEGGRWTVRVGRRAVDVQTKNLAAVDDILETTVSFMGSVVVETAVPKIVAKDALGGAQTVVLRRFDETAQSWEVATAGGAVSIVPMDALALDLGLPLPQLRAGASPPEPHSRRSPL